METVQTTTYRIEVLGRAPEGRGKQEACLSPDPQKKKGQPRKHICRPFVNSSVHPAAHTRAHTQTQYQVLCDDRSFVGSLCIYSKQRDSAPWLRQRAAGSLLREEIVNTTSASRVVQRNV